MEIGLFALGMILSFIISVVLLRIFIPVLKSIKLGQKILDIGPRWHKSKEGTPIMGGVFFGAAALIGFGFICFFAFKSGNIKDIKLLLISMAFAVCNFLTGFIDDYIKLVLKRNKGLSAAGKFMIQLILAAAYIASLRFFCSFGTELFIPFAGYIDFGVFYYPIMLLGIVYIVNCVNLTDGVDGLCGSVTLIVAMFFTVLGFVYSDFGVLAISLSLVGALAGFLVFNLHPAKIFMGDTGSLMLGGVIVAMATVMKMPLIIVICGFVYLFEGLSVMIQVLYFKITHGKRLFKMSPLHHHFELCGWSENKIVTVFTASTVILCAIAYLGVIFVY